MKQARAQLEDLTEEGEDSDFAVTHFKSSDDNPPPTTTGGANRPQRTIQSPWWLRWSSLNWQMGGKHGLRLVVFVLAFVACGAVGKSGKAGIVAHLFAGLINPIPLILAMGFLGLYALLSQRFSALLLAHELLLAFLIAQEIVNRFI